ncbi:epoxyqueuosine reductase [Solibaculum mannosilyticum]|uniref:epoxyqueuosine reductase n=1 Tax=Solibaculum mannosilyticum TaxID=2780922 RepID=UPI0007A87F29|nr:Epoxyqueuosine reductase [Eubacteriaceae bacterium CHKCI005]
MIQFDAIVPLLQEAGTDIWGCCAFEKIADRLIPCRARKRLMDGAQSILVGLFPYLVRQEEGNLCRYARVPDYHCVVGDVLEGLQKRLKEAYPSFSFESFVDNSPIPEVQAAALAGLGTVGDSGLLLHPEYGSWCFIGEIVTDLPVKPTGKELVRCIHCGACRRACPGRTLGKENFVRTNCVSDITQKKKDLTEEEEEKIAQNGLCWGCDTCQLVCPYNREVTIRPLQAFAEHYVPSYPPEQGDDLPRAWEWRGEAVIQRNLRIILGKKGHTKPAK